MFHPPPDPPQHPLVTVADLEPVRADARAQIAALVAQMKGPQRVLVLAQNAAWFALDFHDRVLGIRFNPDVEHPFTTRQRLVPEVADSIVWLDEWTRAAATAFDELESSGKTELFSVAWLAEPVFNWADGYGTPVDVALEFALNTRERVIAFLESAPSPNADPLPGVEFLAEDGAKIRSAGQANRPIQEIPLDAIVRRIGRYVREGLDLEMSGKNGGLYLWPKLAAHFERLRHRLKLNSKAASQIDGPNWVATALALIATSNDLSIADIARMVGRDRGRLYANQRIAEAWNRKKKLTRSEQTRLPRSGRSDGRGGVDASYYDVN